MPHIKINQPTGHWLGTTIEIDGKKISKVRSIDYHVAVDEPPEISLEVARTTEIDLEAKYIKLDISPANVESAMQILKHELSKNNPRCVHYEITNELRTTFIANIASVLQQNEKLKDWEMTEIISMAGNILDRIIEEG